MIARHRIPVPMHVRGGVHGRSGPELAFTVLRLSACSATCFIDGLCWIWSSWIWDLGDWNQVEYCCDVMCCAVVSWVVYPREVVVSSQLKRPSETRPMPPNVWDKVQCVFLLFLEHLYYSARRDSSSGTKIFIDVRKYPKCRDISDGRHGHHTATCRVTYRGTRINGDDEERRQEMRGVESYLVSFGSFWW